MQHKTEEEVEKRKRHIVKLEASIKKMSEELLKGNEIIKKLQNDIRNYHAKVHCLGSLSLLVLYIHLYVRIKAITFNVKMY